MSDLARFVKSAEKSARFGLEYVEHIYAQGREHLGDHDLGLLAVHLRRIEPKWKPSRAERNRLALALIESGLTDSEVVRLAGVSRTTCWRLRTSENPQPVADQGREPAWQSGADVSNRAPVTDGTPGSVSSSRPPILHFDATSGASW